MLGRAAALLCADQLDALVIAQHFHVIADLAHTFSELTGQFLGARDPFVENPQNLNAKIMGQSFDQPLIDWTFSRLPSFTALFRQRNSFDP